MRRGSAFSYEGALPIILPLALEMGGGGAAAVTLLGRYRVFRNRELSSRILAPVHGSRETGVRYEMLIRPSLSREVRSGAACPSDISAPPVRPFRRSSPDSVPFRKGAAAQGSWPPCTDGAALTAGATETARRRGLRAVWRTQACTPAALGARTHAPPRYAPQSALCRGEDLAREGPHGTAAHIRGGIRTDSSDRRRIARGRRQRVSGGSTTGDRGCARSTCDGICSSRRLSRSTRRVVADASAEIPRSAAEFEGLRAVPA